MEKVIYKFLWKGPDKVSRVSVINSLNDGGLNLTDLVTHIKALRLSWITRVIGEREGPWKSYLLFHLKKYGGVFLLKCNYVVNDLNLKLSGFYLEMLQWWVEFRNHFADINFYRYIIWNNKDIRIANKPVFYKTYLERGILSLKDLKFEKDNVHSFEFQKSEGLNTNFLT